MVYVASVTISIGSPMVVVVSGISIVGDNINEVAMKPLFVYSGAVTKYS